MDIYGIFGINMVLDGSALLIAAALAVISIRAGKRHGDRTENRLFCIWGGISISGQR